MSTIEIRSTPSPVNRDRWALEQCHALAWRVSSVLAFLEETIESDIDEYHLSAHGRDGLKFILHDLRHRVDGVAMEDVGTETFYDEYGMNEVKQDKVDNDF